MRTITATPTTGMTGPEALAVADVPTPSPGPGQVLVRVEAAGVNPLDLMVTSGVLHEVGWLASESVGLGVDVAGVVEALGPDVAGNDTARLPVGTPVAAVLVFRDAPSLGYADYVVVPAADLVVRPAGLGAVEAATVPLNSLTAAQALDLLGPARGRSLLVTGAAGAVGGYAAQLAAELGWAVTGLARAGDADFVASTGAALVTDLPDAPGFDAVLDAAVLGHTAIVAVRDGGEYVGVVGLRPMAPERGIRVQSVAYTPDGARLAGLLQRTASGELPARVAQTVPLADAADAHRLAGEGGLRGRVVLVP